MAKCGPYWLKERDLKEIASTSANGHGWTGKIYRLSGKGEESATALVARANGTEISYFLVTDWPATSEEAERFLSSFAINPVKAVEVHKDYPQIWLLPDEWRRALGYCGLLLILLFFAWRCFAPLVKSLTDSSRETNKAMREFAFH